MSDPLHDIIQLWETQHIDPPGNAMAAARFMTLDNATVRAWAALTTAAYELRFGDRIRAEELLETARDQLPAPHTPQEHRCAWLTNASWGYLLLRGQEVYPALKHISALQLNSNPAIQPADWCMLHTILHFIYKRLGDFETSLQQIYTALHLALQHQLHAIEPVVRINLAALLMEVEDWAAAAEQLVSADQLAGRMHNHALVQRIRINRAVCAHRVNDLSTAQTLTRECLAYSGLDEGSMTELWINAAQVCLALKDQVGAEQSLERVLQSSQSQRNARLDTAVAHVLGQVHMGAARWDQAHAALDKSAALARAHDELRISALHVILQALAQVHAQRGDFKNAYLVAQEHHEVYKGFMAYRIKNAKLTLAVQAQEEPLGKLQYLSEVHAMQVQQQLLQIAQLKQKAGFM
jgi:hypothetical protein